MYEGCSGNVKHILNQLYNDTCREWSLVSLDKTSQHDMTGMSLFPWASFYFGASLGQASEDAWTSRIQSNGGMTVAPQIPEQCAAVTSSSSLGNIAWATSAAPLMRAAAANSTVSFPSAFVQLRSYRAELAGSVRIKTAERSSWRRSSRQREPASFSFSFFIVVLLLSRLFERHFWTIFICFRKNQSNANFCQRMLVLSVMYLCSAPNIPNVAFVLNNVDMYEPYHHC